MLIYKTNMPYCYQINSTTYNPLIYKVCDSTPEPIMKGKWEYLILELALTFPYAIYLQCIMYNTFV